MVTGGKRRNGGGGQLSFYECSGTVVCVIETASTDATQDGSKRSAKALTLKMRGRFLSISTPPACRPPFGKAEKKN